MDNLIIIAIVIFIVTLAGVYIYKEKKKGKKCIGCPDGGNCCSGACGSCNMCDTVKDK